MSVFLTGGTGFIGSSVLRRLIAEGHEVTALVRSTEKADTVEAEGATALIGDITDSELVSDQASRSDGVIHTASPGDDTAAAVDDAFVTAVFAGLEGSSKPYVHTSGIWIYGDNSDITESSEFDPPAGSRWRLPIDERVRTANGVHTAIVVPSIVYGYGRGLPTLISDAPRGSGVVPVLHLIGDGSQHWPTVHVDDLAALYVLAFEQADAGSLHIGASGENPTVRELGAAAADAAHIAGGDEAETIEATRARLGRDFADALMLDQQATGSGARIEFGWEPNGPTLIDELTTGSYAPEDR
jgi:nucleoside-diphosphate-sugar epimerase